MDERWKDCNMEYLDCSIGESGCALTSFTMVQQFYGGTENPKQVNSRIGDNACPFHWDNVETEYNYDMTKIAETVSYKDTLTYVKAAIQEKHPLIIGMALTSDNTHFVAVYGYAYDNIMISDPSSRNYQYLQDYMDDGYYINRIIIYENN